MGNFLGDFTRSKDIELLNDKMSYGVKLHRAIDTYTDQHEAFKNTVKILRPEVGKYSSVAIDIINDHFLTKYWEDYTDENLREFCDDFYDLLLENFRALPQKLSKKVNVMIDHDFLMSTTDEHRLYKTLQHMDRRARHRSNFEGAFDVLQNNYDTFLEEFRHLYKDLVVFVDEYEEL